MPVVDLFSETVQIIRTIWKKKSDTLILLRTLAPQWAKKYEKKFQFSISRKKKFFFFVKYEKRSSSGNLK